MLDLFQIATSIKDNCGGLGPIVNIIKQLINILHILIPIALIAYGTLDLGKAVMASDDKQVKEAQGKLIKRCVYAIVIFLIPYLVGLIMQLVDTAASAGDPGEITSSTYKSCWDDPTGKNSAQSEE